MNLPKYKKTIDQQLVDKLISFLSKTPHHNTMVRITEDANSQVAAVLLQQALKDNAMALIFDFETTQTSSLIEICKNLNLNTYVLKRGAAYQTEVASFGKNLKHYQRFINYHLLIQADLMRIAVVDTVDKSDRLLEARPQGFYGHFMPFYSLYKSELFDLAHFLQISVDNHQTFQDLTYDKIDPILYLLTEKQLTPEEISLQYNCDLHFLKKLKSHIDKQLFHTPASQFII